MTRSVKTYSAGQIKVVFGAHLVTGVAPDTFLVIEQAGDGTTAEAGAYGDVSRALSLNPLHTVTLTLQQTSRSNDALSAAYHMDQTTQGGGALPLLITDLRGTTVFAGTAWIPKLPSTGFASGNSNREWTFEAAGTLHVGGND